MTTERLLAAVLPSSGHRFILVTFGEQGSPDFRPVQRSFPPGQEADAISYAYWGSGKGANAYFATAGFHVNPDEPNAGRTGANAHTLRCLRVDIDCGAGKPYPDKRAGVAALGAFCEAYALPAPWIVDSGHGLHAYWPFDQDVPTQVWASYAQRLATACHLNDFHVDQTTTVDAARVLRVPGTNNYKRSGCEPVRILHEGVATAPEQLMLKLPAGEAPLLFAIPAAMQGLVLAQMEEPHQPYFLRGVLTQCPGMAAMVNDGGVRAREPLWKASLDLIWKSDDDEESKWRVARAVSAGHAGFSEDAFAAKWNQTRKQDYHPPTCRVMQGAGMLECAGCPFRGKISSPLTLGRAQPPRLPDEAPLPPPAASVSPPTGLAPPSTPLPAVGLMPMVGVFRSIDATRIGVIDGPITKKLSIDGGQPMQLITVPNEDGTERKFLRPILCYRLLEVERLIDVVGQRSVIALTMDRGLDKPVRVEFTHGDLSDTRAFHTKLMANNLYATRKDSNIFVEQFMPEFLAQLQRSRAANQIAGRCGWTDDRTGFVLGSSLITAGGVEHVRPGGIAEEMLAYRSEGDEALWRRAMDIVLAGGSDRQAVVALAIASPLMVFTGLNGVLLNAYSPESGIGKSTLGDASLSIWGSPDDLRKSAQDTQNATWRIAGVTGNMPMVIDEFTNVEGRALSDFVYTVTQGREKHRLGSDAKLQAGGSLRWCLAAITTANNSIHDKLQAHRADAVAEATRVFDLRLTPLHVSASELGRLKSELQALRANFGFLGPRVVQMFLSKPPEYWREMVSRKISEWDAKVGQSASDRFRAATAALIEIGAAVGAAMGLQFDTDRIKKLVASAWQQQLDEFESERRKPIDFVKTYLVDFANDFQLMGGVHGDLAMSSTPRKLRGEIRGRSVDGKFKPATVMIPTDLLRKHVRDTKGNYKSFREWIKTAQLDGTVTRIGVHKYLEGSIYQISTDIVEFSAAALLHDEVMERLIQQPNPNALPPRSTP
jgi:hypothetical protein